MKPDQEGAYIHLIAIDWKEDGLLDDISVITHLSRISKKRVQFIIGKWMPHPRKEGFLTHPRLEKERRKQRAFKRKKSQSGKAGAKKRWENAGNQGGYGASKGDSAANGDAIKVPMAKYGSSSSSSITSLNIYITHICAMKKRPINFSCN